MGGEEGGGIREEERGGRRGKGGGGRREERREDREEGGRKGRVRRERVVSAKSITDYYVRIYSPAALVAKHAYSHSISMGLTHGTACPCCK